MTAADLKARIIAAFEAGQPIVGVLECPSMRPNGTVIQTPGYDRDTGWLYEPQIAFPVVPENPTQEEACAALAALTEPFLDFPWTSPAHMFVAIAAVLTLVARPAIRGSAPGFVYDASTRGSGKSLTGDTVSEIAHGREAARMNYPEDPAELGKVLGAYALRSASLIVFDNVTTAFGGGPLDLVLTATDKVELRVLGQSDVPAMRWRAVIMAMGNNVCLGPDTARRVLFARMEPDCERPEERTGFAHPDLLGWVRAERPRLVRAALVVLRGFVAAGRPEQDIPGWGSFGPWRDLVAQAIVWAGGPNVLTLRGTDTDDVDPELAALRVLLAKLPDIAPEGATAGRILDDLYGSDKDKAEHEHGALIEAIGHLPLAITSAKAAEPAAEQPTAEEYRTPVFRLTLPELAIARGLLIDPQGPAVREFCKLSSAHETAISPPGS